MRHPLLYRLLLAHALILILGGHATAFLGTQGDVWDTQWGMFLALVGALAAQLTLSGVHDRQLARASSPSGSLAMRVR